MKLNALILSVSAENGDVRLGSRKKKHLGTLVGCKLITSADVGRSVEVEYVRLAAGEYLFGASFVRFLGKAPDVGAKGAKRRSKGKPGPAGAGDASPVDP